MPLWNDMDQTPSQTEDAAERGFVDELEDSHLGEAGADEDADAGDIADEGPGHRG
jgi:hypothetical protein